MSWTNQPCWTCQKCFGGCSWTDRDPETGQLKFKPVEGWDAIPRIYGERKAYNVKAIESYEIISCPEYVPDGSEHRKPVLLPPGWEDEIKD